MGHTNSQTSYTQESKQAALQRLLQSMSSEPEDHVRKTICDIVATTYEYLVEKKRTPLDSFFFPSCVYALTRLWRRKLDRASPGPVPADPIPLRLAPNCCPRSLCAPSHVRLAFIQLDI